MVRTRGAHCYRPKVQFSTPERDGAGTSKAAAGHSPAQVTETPPALAPATTMIQGPAPATISEEAQASEPPSRRYQTRVGPRPPSPVHPRPCWRAPPSKRGGHLARVSLRGLSPSRRLLQLIRVRRPSYPHIRGSRVQCSAAIQFQGTSIFVPETSMESHTTIYRH